MKRVFCEGLTYFVSDNGDGTFRIHAEIDSLTGDYNRAGIRMKGALLLAADRAFRILEIAAFV